MVEHVRIGIVDMGSNAIRFMIAETSGAEHRIIENHRLALQLGRTVFQTGQIPETLMADTVDAFRRFKASCDRLGVKRTHAIATSAMRDARNRDLLVDRVRDACGIEIDVISGTQEAYLLKLGIETRMDLSTGRSLLVDIGGGSVEIVVVEDGHVASANSYRLGALRMLETFRDAEPGTFAKLLEQHLIGLDHRIAKHLDIGPIDRYAAVGGNIDCLTDIVSKRLGATSTHGIDACALRDLEGEVRALDNMTIDERIERHGLGADRAETIVPAGIVYAHIGNLAKAERVLVPRTGIKEGLLVEVIKGHRASFAVEDHVDVALGSCRALGRFFHFESQHAESVLHLAGQLFDQTSELHGLGARARVVLQAAALLHDIGVAVSNDGHHKHSQYLIESTELVGLGDYDRHLVAMLARYHRKAMPTLDHPAFMALRRRDRTLIERLAALLRLADALDRQHSGVVTHVEVKVRKQRLELRATVAAEQETRLTLEAKAIAAKGALFERLFALKPTLVLA